MSQAAIDKPLQRDAWWKGAILPVAVLAVVGAAAGGAILLSSSVTGDDAPPEPPAFVAPPQTSLLVFDVKQRAGETLTLTPDPKSTAPERTLALTPAVRVEVLERIEIGGVQTGDFVTIYGAPNDYKNFAVRFIAVASTDVAAAGSGFFVSKAGFNGVETTRLPEERPIVGGVVERVEGKTIIAKGATGELRITVEPAHRLFRLREGTTAEIRDGYRVTGDFSQDPPKAILVRASGTD